LGQKLLLLFVHGLGGDETTWGQFPSLLKQDQLVSSRIEIAFYGYPTKLIRLPWSGRSNRIQDLSRAIRTEFAARFHSYSSVIIVAHSLGGLIAQKFIIEELKGGTPLKVSGLISFAVPSAGAGLASFGDILSFRHFQIRQLRKHSDVLESINTDWRTLNCNEKIKVVRVYGGQDKIVPQVPNPEYQSEFIAEEDHSSIVKPKSNKSTAYLIVRNFILTHLGMSERSIAVPKSSEVLFDANRPESEPFYIERREDFVLSSYLSRQNVWLFGPSGFGKTAALTRSLMRAQAFRMVSLGHYSGCTVKELFAALHQELASTLDEGLLLDSWPRLIEALAEEMTNLCNDGIRWIFVEEMPIADPHSLTEFLSRLSSLLILHSKSRSGQSVAFAFSSVTDPTLQVTDLPRVSQILKVIRFAEWRRSDIEKLLRMALTELNIELSEADQADVLAAARMSPRFIKVFLGNYLSLLPMMTESRAALDEALASTKLEVFR